MASAITIEILGDPIPLKRHRSRLIIGKISTYDPQIKEKNVTRLLLTDHMRRYAPFDPQDTYAMWIDFYMPIPKSFTKAKKKAIAEGKDEHYSKPDLSNLIKYYEDCMTGICYHDDSRITQINAEKKYDHNPRTVITLIKNENCFDNKIAPTLQ